MTKVGSGSKFGVKAIVYFQKALLPVAAFAPGVLQCSVELGLQDSCNVLFVLC